MHERSLHGGEKPSRCVRVMQGQVRWTVAIYKGKRERAMQQSRMRTIAYKTQRQALKGLIP